MKKEEAIRLSKSGWWIGETDREVAEFQLKEPLLCCPFGVFHKAVEGALGRPVWTHEFALPGELLAELHGESKPRTFSDVLQKAKALMGDKPVIVVEVPPTAEEM